MSHCAPKPPYIVQSQLVLCWNRCFPKVWDQWDLCFQKISTMFCTEKKKNMTQNIHMTHDPRTIISNYKYHITIYNLTSANPTFPTRNPQISTKHTKPQHRPPAICPSHRSCSDDLSSRPPAYGREEMLYRSYGLDPHPIPSIWTTPSMVKFRCVSKILFRMGKRIFLIVLTSPKKVHQATILLMEEILHHLGCI